MQAFSNIKIVLNRPSHPGNIGAAARAMKTMQLERLVLVAPDIFPDAIATARAAGAEDILTQAVIVGDLETAIADCHLVLATSARIRSLPERILNPRASGEHIYQEAQQDRQVAIVFGREDSGLSNEELQKCHYHIHIPVNPDYGSLNLAAAVQVVCYEIMMAQLMCSDYEKPVVETSPVVQLATVAQMEQYFLQLEGVLKKLNFLKQQQPNLLMARLRRFYKRARVEVLEYNILRGILTAIQKLIP
jgi:tRNA (cytidine32/uridine32-2'-O)-methyltransferase